MVKLNKIVFLIIFTISANHGMHDFTRFTSSTGLFPSIFNLASHARINTNATCGMHKSEVYCTLAEGGQSTRCGVCDNTDPDKAHPPELAIDGSDRWWQSPSLQYGPAYHSVTLTINLNKIYQVAYIIITAGVAPRPANWVLERSLDGSTWEVWQYHAQSDEQCWLLYGLEPRKGKPSYKDDDEVICTSYYSSMKPLEGGEISISLVNERPGAQGPSRTLLEFTKARFIRLRLHGLQTMSEDQVILADDSNPQYASVARRYFYSIKDISIGGQCPCHGHASECPVKNDGDYQCKCRHNTCGELCDSCCPMFNQKRWTPGKFISGNDCERCQCFGHSNECYFDPQVESERKSLNTAGKYSGGGVCINCRDKTTGVNCEKCLDGYYRPTSVSRFEKSPCRKCECNSPGSEGAGRCYADSEFAHKGFEAGDCICKPGFTGSNCDRCAVGYRDYPYCKPCPCNMAGTIGGQCSGNCQCKRHATGPRCDRCKAGFFALIAANPDGCTECFCYGVTNICDSADLGVEVLDHESGWYVTDISGRIRVSPYWSSATSGLTIAQEDIALDAYYWEAPPPYIGNRLVSYGQMITVHTSWHAGRGDTSGTPTKEPDVIIEGAGFRIGFGNSDYRGSKNATIKLVFLEHDWYHLPGGGQVTKHQFMQCLGKMERLLIRAKYHSDQLEGTLHTAAMEFGAEGSLSLTRTKAVEKCNCPPGYTGLSCEACGYGYTRVNNTVYRGTCRKCDCNGHSATCDPSTLKCGACEHNTIGEKCEACATGFYGNAKLGRPNDCKPCKCPLDVPSNNFSPTCQIATMDYDKYSMAPEEYRCTACPQGYEGEHCGRCANGYFGNPLAIGDYCKPCLCNSNEDISSKRYCDHITGQCLACLGNTGGWHCDTCLPGYYGNPGDGFCKPCQCNMYGSRNSECDPRTGQCLCKEKYIGRTCGQCKDGFGAIRAGCRQCGCNRIGSEGDFCDADTGQCFCRPGVTGIICDKCLPLHYGFSRSGCGDCGCHEKGSINEQCDSYSGSCGCLPQVKNRKCDACDYGYWGIMSGKGCKKCLCDPMGAQHNDCDDVTGDCACKPGVGGPTCDACLVGYWGISHRGCKECQPCEKHGHVCDPDTGRCICPVLTEGSSCERCKAGTWNYDSYKGCRKCQCHKKGSVGGQCDVTNGHCRCLEGFEGAHCDKCSPGFYNFPNCRACNCNQAGTDPSACKNGICQCDRSGLCPCKNTAVGKKCASCSRGFFGLSESNNDGCTQCFCFGRSRDCQQSPYSWTQLAMPRRRQLTISRGDSNLKSENGYIIIPGDNHDAVIGVSKLFDVPIYWQLPEMFLGDKVLSYNGYLRFGIQSNGNKMFPEHVLDSYPLVFIQGNHNIKLMYHPKKLSGSGRYEVHIHEANWVNINNPKVPVTRMMLMIGLQGIQQLYIRATEAADTTVAMVHGISLDVARPSSIGAPRQALGVEMCQCPGEYEGTSCQDPGSGFYRYYKSSYAESEIIIDLVGESIPCMCNGRADHCESDTGFCIQCRENTAGAWCDICAPGFFGDPMKGISCTPCECPSSSKNFAQTCYKAKSREFVCQCRDGYTGPRCERCAYGYYGNPSLQNGECLSCDCNPFGSETDQCEAASGQCYCVPGVTGRACDQCKPRHMLTHQRTCKNCNDGCVGTLLDNVEEIQYNLDTIDLDDLDPAPMLKLTNYRKISENMETEIETIRFHSSQVSLLLEKENYLGPEAELTLLESNKLSKMSDSQMKQANEMYESSRRHIDEAATLDREIKDMILYLENHGREHGSTISLTNALRQASDFLRQVKSKDFSEFDIKSRTEMSNARILYETVEKILFGEIEISSITEKTNQVDALVNDLLQYLNEGMATMRDADEFNKRNNLSLTTTVEKCSKVDGLISFAKSHIKNGKSLTEQGDLTFQSAREFFQNIIVLFRKLQSKAELLEAREIGMSAVVEDYRTRYVLPCQANAEKLFNTAKKIKDMFNNKVGVDAEQAIQAANAYRKIIDGLDEARIAAVKALDASVTAYQVADPPGHNNLRHKAQNLRFMSEDLKQEAQGLWKNSDDMSIQLNSIKLDLEKYLYDVKLNEKQIIILQSELERHSYVSDYAKEAKASAKEALAESDSAKQRADDLMQRIKVDLRSRTNELNSFSTDELGSIPRKIAESQTTMQNVEKQASYLESRTIDLDKIQEKVRQNLAKLKSQMNLAKHAAASIKISITGNDSEAGVCLRSYSIGLSPSTHNEISIIYGIEGSERDSPLVYIPSSKRSVTAEGEEIFDFMAIEMIDRKIHFLWNNGAGTKIITHNVEIETAFNLARQDSMWYKITAERIGNIGRLNVRKVRPKYDLPEYHKWEVGESEPTSNILDVQPTDRLWVGGAPNYYKSEDLQSKGNFNGVLYQLSVNKKNVGLWSLVTSFGCQETHSGVTDIVQEHSCHTFSGDGYATQDQIRNYDPRYYAVSMEFKTFDQDTSLVLVANQINGQYLSTELRNGKVYFKINYGNGVKLEFSSKDTYNSGQWVKIEAGRAFRNGLETGVLRVTFNGVREDFVDSLPSITTKELDLQSSKLFFGGVPPDFDFSKFSDLQTRSLLGSLRGITTSNPGSNSLMNPLYTEYGKMNPYYGVIPTCENKILKTVSFSGNGHIEVKSQPLRKDSSFGFTFKSQQPDALVALSTFLGKPSGDLADFYSVSLVGGRLALVFGQGSDLSQVTSFITEKTYNDGAHHTVFVIKRNRKISVYVDDLRVDRGEIRLAKNAIEMKAPSHGGLFLGGVPSVISSDILNSKMAASVENLVGTILDFAFIDDVSVRIVAMNEPVSFFNTAIGRDLSQRNV